MSAYILAAVILALGAAFIIAGLLRNRTCGIPVDQGDGGAPGEPIVQVVCDACHGRGYWAGYAQPFKSVSYRACTLCHGNGYVTARIWTYDDAARRLEWVRLHIPHLVEEGRT